MGLVLGLGRSPVVGNGNPLQHSCLENFMDREFHGQASVHRVAKSRTRRNTCMCTCTHTHKNINVYYTSIYINIYYAYLIRITY